MCNLYSLETGDLFATWEKVLRLPVVWQGQASNFEPRPEIKMTELAPIVRHAKASFGQTSCVKFGRRFLGQKFS